MFSLLRMVSRPHDGDVAKVEVEVETEWDLDALSSLQGRDKNILVAADGNLLTPTLGFRG